MPNRLLNETSPYLVQHANNPVDWYPWGEEALQKAREEDKPIFLSIGYSACHWCHVMERGVLRERPNRPHNERALRKHKGGQGGATGSGLHLHGGSTGHDRPWGMAHVDVPDTRRRAFLRRHLLPPGGPPRDARLPQSPYGARRDVPEPTRRHCTVG